LNLNAEPNGMEALHIPTAATAWHIGHACFTLACELPP
jgi:hypothetical protein